MSQAKPRRLLGVLALVVGTLACDRNQERVSTPPPDETPKEKPAPAPEPEGAAEAAAAQPPEEEAAPPRASRAPEAKKTADQVDESVAAALKSLSKWAESRGGRVHVSLIDLEADERLLGLRQDEPVNPASNMKLLTAAATLDLLGPAHTFVTELRGRIDGKGRARVLALRGGGAPDLKTADLYRLARVAKGRGLKKVDAIVVNQDRFTDDYVPPAFEQQPGEWAPFRAPISALAVDGNQVALNVLPTSRGKPAHVWYQPPGVVRSRGSVETAKAGSGDEVTWSLSAGGDPQHLLSKVGGSIGEGLGRRRYERRLEDPRLAPGHIMRSILEELGIEVGDGVRLDNSQNHPVLAYLRSEPVSELIRPLGKKSDNFTAEMLLVALSHADETSEKKDGPWSSARGARVLMQWLERGSVPLDGVVIKNGSGLFDANELTPRVITHVLARMEARPEVFPEYLSQLAIWGTDGTLARRGRKHPLRGRIRAKTGTLRDINALSGFILRSDGKRPVAFSIIVAGVLGRHGEARTHIDRAVSVWAKALGQ